MRKIERWERSYIFAEFGLAGVALAGCFYILHVGSLLGLMLLPLAVIGIYYGIKIIRGWK